MDTVAVLLWHDDVRPAPLGWVGARTNDEAIGHLSEPGRVEVISMDHDLGATPVQVEVHGLGARGQGEETGVHLARWMVENRRVPAVVGVHSWNPAGAEAILEVLKASGKVLYRVAYCPEYVFACEREASYRLQVLLGRHPV